MPNASRYLEPGYTYHLSNARWQGASDPTGNLRSFYNGVRQGTTVYPGLMDGARAVAVIFAPRRSPKWSRLCSDRGSHRVR